MATCSSARLVLQICRQRSGLIRPSYSILKSVRLASSASQRKLKEGEDFFNKNARMERPLSPHLTIYKFQLPAILSVSHRGTGIALTGVTSAVALAALVLPGNIGQYFEMVQNLGIPSFLILSGKCLLVYPFWFHTANGIRHMFWDTGRGFDLRVLYKSGYSVVIAALLATVATVGYFSI